MTVRLYHHAMIGSTSLSSTVANQPCIVHCISKTSPVPTPGDSGKLHNELDRLARHIICMDLDSAVTVEELDPAVVVVVAVVEAVDLDLM